MRLVVAMTGATGAVYGVRLLQVLAGLDVETHLVISRWARTTLTRETGLSVRDVSALATVTHSPDDQGAVIASGSFRVDGTVIAPCSMKTLAAVRGGYGEGLVARAADVALKERTRLVLLARETPLSPVHLENMLALARLGVVIMPPVPAFYQRPLTIADLVDQTVERVLDQFGLTAGIAPRWTGLATPPIPGGQNAPA